MSRDTEMIAIPALVPTWLVRHGDDERPPQQVHGWTAAGVPLILAEWGLVTPSSTGWHLTERRPAPQTTQPR